MKQLLLSFICILLLCLSNCKKKDFQNGSAVNLQLSDTALSISSVAKIDINEFKVTCQIKPRIGETYTNMYLIWSTSSDFKQPTDSILIMARTTGSFVGEMNVTGLLENKTYYFHIALLFNNQRFISTTVNNNTDSLKILQVNVGFLPSTYLSHNDTASLRTNFVYSAQGISSPIQVTLGQVSCPITSNTGEKIYFRVPSGIATGKYKLRLTAKNMTAFAEDSLEVLFGEWANINSAPYPVNPYTTQTGLIGFGAAHSDSKGYIVGGSFFNGYDLSDTRESMHLTSLYEYDLQQNQWLKKPLNNKKYLESPICYYHNNNIYVIGGIETVYNWLGSFWDGHRIFQKTMKRLDLTNYTWYEMDSLPFPTIFNMVSFELNGEFYIGMGADSSVMINGEAQPSRKLWKYNPNANAWTRLADYPGTGYQINPTGFSMNGNGYIFYNAIPLVFPTNFRSEFWRYNPQTNSWTQIPQVPSNLNPQYGEKYEVVVKDNKAYFISCQKYSLGVAFYYYALQNVCQEYDPQANSFKQIALMRTPNIVKYIGRWGNKFFFQAGAHGYYEAFPNITYSLNLE